MRFDNRGRGVALVLALVASLAGIWWVRTGRPPSDAARRPPVAARERARDDVSRASSARPGTPQAASVEILVRGLALGETCPAAGAEVGLRRDHVEGDGNPEDRDSERPRDRSFVAKADASGVARFEDLSPGRWRAVARAPGFYSTGDVFEVRAVGGAPHRWDLTLEAHASLHVSAIAPEGGAVPGAVVRVALSRERPPSRLGLHPDDAALGDPEAWTTGSDGQVLLGVVPVGTAFTLVVDHTDAGRRVQRVEPFEPGERRSISAVLEPHTVLVGTVARAPAPGVHVAVECWHAGENVRGLVAEHKAPASSDRRFALRNLSGGRKRLVYTATTDSSVEVGTLDVVAPAGVETDVGAIPVRNSAVRVLIVSDEDRQPLADVALSVIWLPDDLDAPSMPLSVRARLGREIVLRGFEEGGLLLSAELLSDRPPLSHPDYAGARARIEFDGTSADVELVLARKDRSATGEIQVRAEPPPGVASEDLAARVYVLAEGDLVGVVARAEPGARRFGFQRFAPRVYQVVAVANGFRAPALTVQVEPGRVSTVTLDRWVPALPLAGRVVQAGVPVPDATVHVLTRSRGPRGDPPPLLEVRTDDRGAFRFRALPAVPELRLRAVSDTGASAPTPVDWDAPVSPLDLELESH